MTEPIAPEDCPEPGWHETHRYCPICSWTEGYGKPLCAHCGVPIMEVSLGEKPLWVHVPSGGPVYLLIACGLVATPISAGNGASDG